jgi:hypothetical protein
MFLIPSNYNLSRLLPWDHVTRIFDCNRLVYANMARYRVFLSASSAWIWITRSPIAVYVADYCRRPSGRLLLRVRTMFFLLSLFDC